MLAPGARFTVLRVLPMPVVPAGLDAAPVGWSAAATDAELEQARRSVLDFVGQIGADADAEGQVEAGAPGPVICEVAQAGGFALIVVGSHGSGLLKQLLLGSVSHHVVQNAPCPVFVDREPAG
jgi:nucleotide-binding universal stress UspA family protein